MSTLTRVIALALGLATVAGIALAVGGVFLTTANSVVSELERSRAEREIERFKWKEFEAHWSVLDIPLGLGDVDCLADSRDSARAEAAFRTVLDEHDKFRDEMMKHVPEQPFMKIEIAIGLTGHADGFSFPPGRACDKQKAKAMTARKYFKTPFPDEDADSQNDCNGFLAVNRAFSCYSRIELEFFERYENLGFEFRPSLGWQVHPKKETGGLYRRVDITLKSRFLAPEQLREDIERAVALSGGELS